MTRCSTYANEVKHNRSHSHDARRHGHRRNRSPTSVGRSTPGSDRSSLDPKTRMRWILSLGLLLPALAAIIGKLI